MRREERDRIAHEKKRTFWQPHIESWQESGVPVASYCKGHHLKPSTFKYWQNIILGKGSRGESKTVLSLSSTDFREAIFASDLPHSVLTRLSIETPRGYKIALESHDVSKDLRTLLMLCE